jgi:tol-pal system protein YbgF
MRGAVTDVISWPSARRLVLAAMLVCGVSAGSSGWAQAQDMRTINERIDRLQRDIDVLQRQLARGGTPAAPGASGAPAGGAFAGDFIGRTEDRFSSLESQLRDLTGNVEQLTHLSAQLKERLDKLVNDIDFRLSALERGAAGAGGVPAAAATPPAAQPAAQPPAAGLGAPVVAPGQQRLVLQPGPGAQAAAVAPSVQLPQGSPEAQYEFAFGKLTQAQREQGELASAEEAWKAFLAANPTHRLAGNAQYWLGETYYARRDYQSAAATFAEGVAKYPRSDKAPDNMLKLGMSLAQLKRNNEACGTLTELDKRYPNATPQVKQAGQRERQRLNCK